ncbi:hypothetical protein PR202_ga12691 [Eleusine coracana subsp. coracana]|uniref:TF-B3 domain-containing protein n=1 Tax=Eleusine coracana subsp. coracana TaxID=191504 RepID=A0AAV5CCE1_ELECO|nr:hypothetical protein PR202_ga12691 [Eleusine coracana subsp. coracana]
MRNSGASISSKHIDHDNPGNELLQNNMVSSISQMFTLQNNALDNEMPGSLNDGREKVLPCASIKNIPDVRETNVHPVDISSSSQHGNTRSSENIERFIGCQPFYHRGKTVKVARTSTSLEDSRQNIPTENRSLESENYEAPLSGDYILSRTSYLSEAQKERVVAFIQETKPKVTVFVSVIGKSSVRPPGSYLGISKEYAFAYFPHESTKEGDLCLLEPTKDEGRSTFTVYLLRASATHASGNDFQRVGPYPGQSIAKIASEVRIKEEPTNAKHVSSERVMHVISHESPESEDSDDPIPIPYPILYHELGVRYAAEYLPATGETMVLQRMGKTWNIQMVIHNGRRWFLNGGWTKFAKDNGLRVGDICLFELKQNERKPTMEVHIISREQF